METLNGEQVSRREAGMCECVRLQCVCGGNIPDGEGSMCTMNESQPLNPGMHEMSLFPLDTPFHWGSLPFPQSHGQIPGACIVLRC